MGVREGLLGLLVAGPSYGYQLKLDLQAATGHGFDLNVGQVYKTLQRLDRDGLVVVAGTDPDDRVLYEITPAGRQVVAAWWAEPVDGDAGARDEVAMKLLLAIVTGSVEPRHVIDVQRSAMMGQLQDYARLRLDEDGETDGDLVWQLRLDRLVYNAEAELRWLDRVEERLARRPDASRPSAPLGPASAEEVVAAITYVPTESTTPARRGAKP